MIKIHEYNAPSKSFLESDGHNKFIEIIINDLRKCDIKNKNKCDISLCVIYDINNEKNIYQLINYNPQLFTDNDDTKIRVLSCDLEYIVNHESIASKDGIKFCLALCFNENPYASFPEIKEKAVSGSGDTTLNVLPVDPKYELSQMVLDSIILRDIEDIITLIQLQDKIYNTWGFSEVDPRPRAIINFYGPSGTGKTMAAHAIANEFGKKILVLNYADIESKYVGDAPKNLMAAFEIAKKHDSLLFFDEADSFLGKRITNVSHSADQAVNSLRSQMLMLLEEHMGIVIFATNLMENYDPAFRSRILRHVKFSLPTKELRLDLIKSKLPKSLPLEPGAFSEENLEKLAETSEGFSGREIKNAVLNGIIRSAKENEWLVYSDLQEAFVNYANTKEKKDEHDKTKMKIRNKLRKTFGYGKKSRESKISKKIKMYRTVRIDEYN